MSRTTNKLYEFAQRAGGVGQNAEDLTVDRLGRRGREKPRVFDIDAIMKMAPLEERIYRHGAWRPGRSSVPWIGFPLNALIKQVEPASKAKFVGFSNALRYRNRCLPAVTGHPLPYVEACAWTSHATRGDFVRGNVRRTAAQPERPRHFGCVPWKYGFKSIKSIVKIRFVEKQPPTTWNISGPREYGFYSNVNPEVDHHAMGQASETAAGRVPQAQNPAVHGTAIKVAPLYAGWT